MVLAVGNSSGDRLVVRLSVSSPDGQVCQGALETVLWADSADEHVVTQALALRRLIANTVTRLGGTMHAAPPSLG